METPAGATDLFGQRANDNGDPLVLDPGGFNFVESDTLRESFLMPAAAFGYSDVTLGPLLNLQPPLSWLIPIRTADYSDYLDEAAENVVALMQHWKDAYGVTPKLLDLFNEPTTGHRELQSSSVQEPVHLVARIGSRLPVAGFADVEFPVPNEQTIVRSSQVAQAMRRTRRHHPMSGRSVITPTLTAPLTAPPQNSGGVRQRHA